MEPILSENISYDFSKRRALDKVSFSAEQGSITGILGPNGSGKTTLFRLISTVLPIQSGDISVCGKNVKFEPAEVRKKLGIVFQSNSLDKKLTVSENLNFAAIVFGLSGDLKQKKISSVIERFDLRGREKDLVGELSGGLARRVEIAKALLHDPEVLLLDEPSTGLDPGARLDLRKSLEAFVSEKNRTVVLTTHLMEEADHCDEILIMNEGKIVVQGSPEGLKKRLRGDVISLKVEDPYDACAEIKNKLSLSAEIIDDVIRVEMDNAHQYIPEIFSVLGSGNISSISVNKPTLEDVFVRETGHTFWGGDQGGIPWSEADAR